MVNCVLFRNILLLLFICSYICISCGENQEVGDECFKENDEGVCKLITDCPKAMEALRQNNGDHQHVRCGFDGHIEIICCLGSSGTSPFVKEKSDLDTQDTPSSKSSRRAEKECEKYKVLSPVSRLNIINGEEASYGEFPHMVALAYMEEGVGTKFDCGGSIVSKNYVLTAAHCVNSRKVPKFARTGVIDLLNDKEVQFDPNSDYAVASIKTHPSHTASLKYNDIALIKLKKNIEMTYFRRPVCLYTKDDNPNDDLVITGWGVTDIDKQEQSQILLKASVKAVPSESCNSTFTSTLLKKMPRGVIQSQLCAGNQGLDTSDACQGDSGGPMQLQTNDGDWMLVGVISFGRGCGSNLPAIYTRVASYLTWIEDVVWPEKAVDDIDDIIREIFKR